jgi:hypothetical protein
MRNHGILGAASESPADMLRRIGALILAFIWYPAVCNAASGLQSADSDVHVYPLKQTVSIPLKLLNPQSAAPTDSDATALLASPGAEDELPEGPNGFDVLEDGRLLISNPLAERVAVFDAQGKFRQSWKLDFPPDGVTLIGHDVVVVRDAATGQLHGFSVDGSPHSLPDETSPKLGDVQLKSGNAAVVTLSAGAGRTNTPMQISFERPGMSLLSAEILAVDKDGNTYIAVESTKGGDEVNVQKDIRKYSPSGKFLGQVFQIPLDYYIPPVNELRVRNGIVYQLDTTKFEVRINMWSTN